MAAKLTSFGDPVIGDAELTSFGDPIIGDAELTSFGDPIMVHETGPAPVEPEESWWGTDGLIGRLKEAFYTYAPVPPVFGAIEAAERVAGPLGRAVTSLGPDEPREPTDFTVGYPGMDQRPAISQPEGDWAAARAAREFGVGAASWVSDIEPGVLWESLKTVPARAKLAYAGGLQGGSMGKNIIGFAAALHGEGTLARAAFEAPTLQTEAGERMAKEAEERLKEIAPNPEHGSANWYLAHSMASFAEMVPVWSAFAFGSGLGFAVMAQPVYGRTYAEEIEKGRPAWLAHVGAMIKGLAFEILPEMIPMKIFLDPKNSAVKRILGGPAAESLQEMITSVLQTAYDVGLDENVTFHEAIMDPRVWRKVWDDGVIGAIVGLPLGVMSHFAVGRKPGVEGGPPFDRRPPGDEGGPPAGGPPSSRSVTEILSEDAARVTDTETLEEAISLVERQIEDDINEPPPPPPAGTSAERMRQEALSKLELSQRRIVDQTKLEDEVAKARGLDMSAEARTQRGREMGYDMALTLYHGTISDFTEFSPTAARTRTTGGDYLSRLGATFLSSSPEVSNSYAESFITSKGDLIGQPGGNVIPVRVRMENPLIIAADGRNWSDFLEDVIAAHGAGHDAVIMRNVRDSLWNAGQQKVPAPQASTVVIFNPANIRSVNAAFDPEFTDSPQLLASQRPTTAEELPMATEERKQRAQEMKFDTDSVWYHGTTEDVADFRGKGWHYFSNTPKFAEKFAFSDQPLGYPSRKIKVDVMMFDRGSPEGTPVSVDAATTRIDGLVWTPVDPGKPIGTGATLTHQASGYSVVKGITERADADAIIENLSKLDVDWTQDLENINKLGKRVKARISKAISEGKGAAVGAMFGYKTNATGFGPGSNVIPVYLRMENPLDLTDLKARNVSPGTLRKALEEKGISLGNEAFFFGNRDLYQMLNNESLVEPLREAAIAAGYDGIIFNDYYNQDVRGVSKIVFDPSQVRSVNAAFDPEEKASPQLLASQRAAAPRPEKQVLDMSAPARLQRGKDMGFDMDTMWLHGTVAEADYGGVDRFIDLEDQPDNQAIGDWMGALGNWFTESPEASGWFAAEDSPEDGGAIYPVRLKLNNPLVFESYEELQSSYEASYAESLPDFSRLLVAEGHDGIIIENANTDVDEARRDAVVFDANQVRSVNAAFDPESAESGDLLLSQRKRQDYKAAEQSRLEEFVNEGLHTEYEEIAAQIDQWIYSSDRGSLEAAMTNDRYGEYIDNARGLFRRVLGNEVVVYRIDGLHGTGAGGAEFVAASYLPAHKELGERRGKEVMEATISADDLVAFGHQAEGEVIVPASVFESAESGDLLLSQRPAAGRGATGPDFYSGLSRAVASLKQAVGTPQQMLNMIKKQPGVTMSQEYEQVKNKEGKMVNGKPIPGSQSWPEIEAIDLEEFIAAKQGKVTRQEIQEYVDANGVQVETKVLGGTDSAGEPEYATGDLVTPGGTNQREVLLTLPFRQKAEVKDVSKDEAREAIISGRRILMFSRRNPDMSPMEITELRRFDSISAGLDRNNDNAYWRFDVRAERATPESTFKGGHYNEHNVILHLRMNDRTGPNGEKILLLEEIQSDWAQTGRKKGYAKPRRRRERSTQEIGKDLKDVLEELNANLKAEGNWGFDTTREARQAILEARADYAARWETTPETVALIEDKWLPLRDELLGTDRITGPVPDMPFKDNAWVELGLKKALRMAAEEGYDSVAWTPGAVQADRYDLSKQIDLLLIGKSEQGYMVRGEKGGRTVIEKSGLSEESLSNLVGKDLSGKAVADLQKDGSSKRYTGLDLKIGGTGMTSFYDQTVPNLMKKVARKLDKSAGVGTTVISSGSRGWTVIHDSNYPIDTNAWRTVDPFGNIEGPVYDTESQALLVLEGKATAELETQAINITPAMREGALAGQPLFSKRPAQLRPEDGRYVVGASIFKDNVQPTDAEMDTAGGQLLRDISKQKSVISARTSNTLGMYAGDPERAFDVEITAGPNFNPNILIQDVAKLGKSHDQYDTFISKVLQSDEVNANARPGIEVYLKQASTEAEIAPIMDRIRAMGADGFTIVVDPQASDPDRQYIGVRMQWVPEMAARWDEDFAARALTPGALQADRQAADKLYDDIAADLLSSDLDVDRVVLADYDTVVVSKENYDDYIAREAGPADQGPQENWFPSSVDGAVRAAIKGHRGAGASTTSREPTEDVPGRVGPPETPQEEQVTAPEEHLKSQAPATPESAMDIRAALAGIDLEATMIQSEGMLDGTDTVLEIEEPASRLLDLAQKRITMAEQLLDCLRS